MVSEEHGRLEVWMDLAGGKAVGCWWESVVDGKRWVLAGGVQVK